LRRDAKIASIFLGPEHCSQDSKSFAAMQSCTSDAMASVYANAERLLFVIFKKFDTNEDLIISTQEMKEAISDLMRDGQLDDRCYPSCT
jgi:hypothetical protein